VPALDYASGRPLKLQIADDLRGQIRSGAYAPGDKLPSVREMADKYEVATETVRAALGELQREGLVQSQSTRGTYVLRRDDASGHGGDELAEVRAEVDALKYNLIDLYGKLGFDYPEEGQPDAADGTAADGKPA